MSVLRRLVPALLLAIGVAWFSARGALACSPPFVPPSLRTVADNQVVVVGTIGERILGGRLFHVERWFNGSQPSTPILIAFKEGAPVGDCSYPVVTGQRLIIAPDMGADGTLAANLATLQADPTTEDGRRYLAEANERFGPGVVPPASDVDVPLSSDGDELPATSALPIGLVVGSLAAAVAALFGGVALAARRRVGS